MTTTTTSRPPALRAGALAVAAAAALGGLSACVAIPTSGPIQEGAVVVDEPGTALPIANDPVAGADPAGIVNGFLSAGAAGIADDFVTARKFLTPSEVGEWDPRAGVVIYPSSTSGPHVDDEREDGTVHVTVPLEATVDAAGRYTEAGPDVEALELVFELRQDSAGEWRISSAPDGVVMSPTRFESLFRPTEVYFATTGEAGEAHLVPDLRWFPASKAATSAVTELLAGPSPYLRDAVVTGAPEGARLREGAVRVTEDGVARVDLSGEANLAESGDRNLLQAQLVQTLDRIPGIDGVEVTVGGLPWRSTDVPELPRDVQPESGPYVLADDRLAVVTGGEVVPLDDVAPLTGLDAREPALSPDATSVRVVLDGARRLLLLPPDAGEPWPLYEGTDLVPPTVDRYGWVWTGERAAGGAFVAVAANGEALPVAAGDWLAGREVRSIDVAADGARIVVVHRDPVTGDVAVDVAGVVRDEDGRPQLVTDTPLPVGAILETATEAVWVDETTVAVLGTSEGLGSPTVHLVRLGGPTRVLPLRDGAVDVAARGEGGVYLADGDGVLLASQLQRSWRQVATGVRDPAFPG